MQKQAGFLDCNLEPLPPGGARGPWGGTGQRIPVDLKSFASTSFSCRLLPTSSAFLSSGDDPAVSHRGHPIFGGVGGSGMAGGQRVEAPEGSRGSACPCGPLGNARFRGPEEVSLSSRRCSGRVPCHRRPPGPDRGGWAGGRGGPTPLQPRALLRPACSVPTEVLGQGGARPEGRGSGSLNRAERALCKGRCKTTGKTCRRSPQGHKAHRKKAGGIGGTVKIPDAT